MMTREQLDAMEVLYIERNDFLDASSYSIPDLIAQAREALELREAVDEALLALEVGSISEGSFVKAIRAARKEGE